MIQGTVDARVTDRPPTGVLAAMGVGVTVLSVWATFQGFSATLDVMFASLASLTTVWALGMGAWIIRNPRRSG